MDATLFAGVRLWQGAELWVNPEIDQGFGLADTHGVAGFPSAEAYKLGDNYPYARVQRYFVRQTIDLGGETEKVDADINQFAGSQTANRLVLTVGKFAVVDIFDTNKYANNPESDFLNWSVVNAGTFDYAGDGWGYTYGAAAEWYQGRWTLRGGIFDLSATPAGGISPTGATVSTRPSTNSSWSAKSRNGTSCGANPASSRSPAFSAAGGREASRMPSTSPLATGQPADINAVRTYTSRPGVSLNLEQQVSENWGVFARAGWADGNVEPWDFTDIDRTVSAGVSINGKQWGRPDDTIGIAGVVNGISGVHEAFLNAGGLGILVGDGQLPNPGLEQIIETYYSYALSASTQVSFDYQFIANPGLQHRPRAGECLCRAVPHRILKPELNGDTPATRVLARLGLQRGREACNGGKLRYQASRSRLERYGRLPRWLWQCGLAPRQYRVARYRALASEQKGVWRRLARRRGLCKIAFLRRLSEFLRHARKKPRCGPYCGANTPMPRCRG